MKTVHVNLMNIKLGALRVFYHAGQSAVTHLIISFCAYVIILPACVCHLMSFCLHTKHDSMFRQTDISILHKFDTYLTDEVLMI